MKQMIEQTRPSITCKKHMNELLDECLFCRVNKLKGENTRLRTENEKLKEKDSE